jgi:hypothetical protein
VLSTIIDVARISYHPFVLCHDNRCGILAFHIP